MYYVMIYLQHCKSYFMILVYFYVAIKFPKEGLIPWIFMIKKMYSRHKCHFMQLYRLF